ncbi:transient receptor potential cation channel subfamily M member 7-like [Rhinophrynus dorsalis]
MSWIEKTFKKRDCVQIIPSSREAHRCTPGCQICQQLVRCCCGRLIRQHAYYAGNSSSCVQLSANPNQESERWTAETHTVKSNTDAFGTIDFQGGSHGYKAKYVRLSNDSKIDDIFQLMIKEWRMEIPKLVISVHGGMQSFELHPQIKEALCKGFIKAAISTEAWIITGGVNNGVASHIGDAMKEHVSRLSHKICTIGIAPWGVIEGRSDLVGKNVFAPYQTLLNPLSKLHVLNSLHSHFILVDDGTVGRHGGEIHIRRELEYRLSLQQIHARTGRTVPVVALILEGGPNTIQTILDYLQQMPPVPVVVCDGSGRAADLLAYVCKQTETGGNLPEGMESRIIATIKKTFNLNKSEAVLLFQTVMACMRKKEFITVFQVGSEKHNDIDVAILTALLKGNNTSPTDRLVMTLAWDRVDIAKNHIFVHGQQWLTGPLEQAMWDALVMDRVDFVKLLIENGVNMHKFLTIPRLEELYNANQGASNDTLLYLIRDVRKGNLPARYKITLMDVGLVIENLMGGAYRCSYTKKHFRTMYKTLIQNSISASGSSTLRENGQRLDRVEKKEKTRHTHFIQTAQPYKSKTDRSSKEDSERAGRNNTTETWDKSTRPFTCPFNDLLVWAVLTKRQKMALFFWQHGEESMAKALVARKLYWAMYHEARQCDIIDDTSDKLKIYSKEFAELAVELLDKSFKLNERMTMKLLTYELSNWSKSTCLKLAVSSKLRAFVAHACTQKLLSDMWMGRLNMSKNSWFKVILGILLPPVIPMLDYKTKAQMSHIPQSQNAHHMTMDDNEEVVYSAEGVTLNVYKGVTTSDGSKGNSIEMINGGKPKRLPLARKFYEFYHAPIVKFWFNTLAYLAFLMLYTFVVLVNMETLPSVQEWIVISVIFTTGVEKIREILMSEAGKVTQKLRVWFSSYLNINETVAIVTFLVGFGLRFGSRNDIDLTEDLVFIAGRLIYCLNIIFWYVRLLDILNVNQEAGPYVLMIGKMVSKMFFIVVIMAIVVISFGVPRKAILYPHEMPSWTLAKDIVFQPYWMTFGEVYAYEIDVCANDSVVPHLCGPGTWLTPFLQAVYLFVQYIIMVNLLIALFNNVYKQGKAISNTLWKFQRYHFIMVYYEKPVLPPPLILFSHVASIISWMCCRKKKSKLRGPKLFLTEEDQKRLHEFEEHCVGLYFIDKRNENNSKSDERIRVTSERVEQLCKDVKEVGDHVNFIKSLSHHLDDHIGHLQDLSGLTLDSLKTLTAQKVFETSRSHSVMSCDLNSPTIITDNGLGQSSMMKRSTVDPIWGRTFLQPGPDRINHFRGTISQRNNISDVGLVDSEVFQRSDFLIESHKENLPESYYNQRLKSLKPKLLRSQSSSHTLSKNQVRSKESSIKSVHSNSDLEQAITECSEVKPAFMYACKKDGYVNTGFIDDAGNSPDIYEDGIKDSDSCYKSLRHSSNETLSLPLSISCDGSTNQETHSTVRPKRRQSEEQISPVFSGNKFTGIFQKWWTKSKHTGHKHQMEKQISVDTNSSEVQLYLENGKTLRRTLSCTELESFHATSELASPNQLQINSCATSHEDLYQTDSKAALLKEPFYSRYSSSHNKSPIQKEAINAVERNNLCRLSQSIPFTPFPPRGELVTVYRLEESSPHILNKSMSSWSHQGFFAKIEFLSREEMGGGLRRALKVSCTWSENDILKPKQLYIIKSFLPDVVNTWAGIYKEDTVLELCLREIQQQRAAQKLLFAFNQMKPKSIPYSPKFLEVFLLYCHSAGQWYTVEECMVGRFRKYNNNTGNENVPTNKLEKTMLAFSHWTYEYTRGEYLVLDLQGVGENLTDPSVIKSGEKRSQDMVFGPANLGDDAIKNFCSQHECNTCCRNLRLPELKRNDYIPDEALLPRDHPLFTIPPSSGMQESSQQPVRVVL